MFLFHRLARPMHVLAAVPLAFAVLWTSPKAAEVTEKCGGIPALVNSLEVRRFDSRERHFLVEYIAYSAAGFYLWDVRVIRMMVLKTFYLFLFLAYGVMTKLIGGLLGL